MMTRHQFRILLRVSFVIAAIIFVTAVCSEFSVRMFYSSTDYTTQVVASLIAIITIMFLIMLFLAITPEIRTAFLRMFGIKDE